ncbi:MAG TPA: glycosyltransferase family 39 protein [Solirubrobacteraceae bacterium]|nr:glycosyltransferase family 39 protein [Solirubrobacteraceae bacterium]
MSSPEASLPNAAPRPAPRRRHFRRPARLRAGARLATRIRPEALALVLLAGTLNLWDLSRNGWANTYYAAAVHSMSESWNNFLFASFDPSGVMTVDKPPLAFWVQTASVKLFGFHPLAILIPQALMGVVTVLLIYDLVRRRFGRPAGFLGGLVLALTPTSVAISRHNNPDALLVLLSVAAVWCAVRALEDRRTRWFVLAGVCLGLGFETKMLAALIVAPGIAAAWVWMALPSWVSASSATGGSVSFSGGVCARARAHTWARAHLAKTNTPTPRQMLAAAGAALLVGGAWPALVELTPAADRPWISGTPNNTALSLIFEYNGLGRLEGQAGGPQALGGSNLFGGSTGPLRLLGEALGGQAGWLLGFALLSAVAILAASRLRRSDPRSGWLLAVGGAFLATAVVFSFAAGIFHPYYVSLLAPFTAALVGAGFGELLRAGARARALSALAVAAGVATELAVLHDYPGELRWLTPTLIVLGALAAAVLVVGGARLRLAALSGALALLLIAPSTWAVDTLGHATSGTFPAGGPADNPATGLGGGGAGHGGLGASQPSLGGFATSGAGSSTVGTVPPAGAIRQRGAPTSGGGPGQPAASRGFPGAAGGRSGAGPAGGSGAGPNSAPGSFAPASHSLTHAVRYAETHGGGTLAVSSQSEAASLVIDGDNLAGIGGFSGRESQTNAAWLAAEVAAGKIRWVLTTSGGSPGSGGGPPGSGGGPPGSGGSPGSGGGPPGSGGGPGPGLFGAARRETRVGSNHAMAAVEHACRRLTAVEGLYDCAGRAAALRAQT